MFEYTVKFAILPKDTTAKEICDYEYYYRHPFTVIKIRDSIEIVGERAFSNNTWLRSVELGANVKFIKKAAFYNCVKLEEVIELS